VDELIYFIDQPNRYSSLELAQLSSLGTMVLCDEPYWKQVGGQPRTVPQKQEVNLAYARHALPASWYLHIDIDEFPIFLRPLNDIVSSMPEEVVEVRIQNVERVCSLGSTKWSRGILRLPCSDPVKLKRHYGRASEFLGMGMSNYFHGKSLVRNKKQIIQNVHGAYPRRHGREIVRYHTPMGEAFIVHYAMMTPAHFIQFRFAPAPELGTKFIHERKLAAFLCSDGDRKRRLEWVLRSLHFASDEAADAMIAAGLCSRFPTSFHRSLEGICEEEVWLDFSFTDASFHDFYSR
jgi:hypothetical protein